MTPFQKKLRSYRKGFKSVQSKVDRDMTRVLKANTTFLAELNRSQLLEGLDESGEPIGNRLPYRSQQYANYKASINPLAGLGNPDLRLTGDYWDSITAVIKNREIQMIATDAKADDLSVYKGIGIAPENYPEIAQLLNRLVKVKI